MVADQVTAGVQIMSFTFQETIHKVHERIEGCRRRSWETYGC